jgi:hypothetical protein
MRPAILAFQMLGKLRETPYRRPHFLFGDSQLVHLLQVQPEFGASPEEMRQAQRAIAGNGALAV